MENIKKIVLSEAFGSMFVVGGFCVYFGLACYLTYLLEVGKWIVPLWLQDAAAVFCALYFVAMAIGFAVEFAKDPADFVGAKRKGG